MKLWAVIPVKPLRRGKSRLADVLTEDQRTQLNINLLVHTLKVLGNIPEITKVLVISRDPNALNLARKHGAQTVQEDGTPELNLALDRAAAIAAAQKAKAVLVLPADLPQIKEEDVRAIIQQVEIPPVMVIAPDHRKRGTNAILVSPAGLLKYDFGGSSFERHLQQAETLGFRVKVCEISSFSRDLDLPEDLEFLNGDVEVWLRAPESEQDAASVNSSPYERLP